MLETVFAIFDLVAALIFSTKFKVNPLLGSGEVQIGFLRWWLWLPSWILDRNMHRDFLSTTSREVQNRFLDHNEFSYFESKGKFDSKLGSQCQGKLP